MAQRQETQLFSRAIRGQGADAALDRGHDILVTQHRTLGGARRARCIDQQSNVAGLRLLDLGLEHLGVLGQMLPAQIVKLLQKQKAVAFQIVQPFILKDDDLFHAGRAVGDFQKLV